MAKGLILAAALFPVAAQAQDKEQVCSEMTAIISMSASTFAGVMLLDEQLDARLAEIGDDAAMTAAKFHSDATITLMSTTGEWMQKAMANFQAYCNATD